MLFLTGARYEDYEKVKSTRRHPQINTAASSYMPPWIYIVLGHC